LLPPAFSIEKIFSVGLLHRRVLPRKEVEQIYCHKLADVPDVDQRWSSLQNSANARPWR
jgi:hypothetical protein